MNIFIMHSKLVDLILVMDLINVLMFIFIKSCAGEKFHFI